VDQCGGACAELQLRPPVPVSLRVGDPALVFAQLVSAAQEAEPDIPLTPSLKVRPRVPLAPRKPLLPAIAGRASVCTCSLAPLSQPNSSTTGKRSLWGADTLPSVIRNLVMHMSVGFAAAATVLNDTRSRTCTLPGAGCAAAQENAAAGAVLHGDRRRRHRGGVLWLPVVQHALQQQQQRRRQRHCGSRHPAIACSAARRAVT